jgi:hypothetical protein
MSISRSHLPALTGGTLIATSFGDTVQITRRELRVVTDDGVHSPVRWVRTPRSPGRPVARAWCAGPWSRLV